MRKLRLALALLAGVLVGGLGAQTSRAAEEIQHPPGMHHTILKRVDLPGTNMEIILGIVEVQPGTTIPRHFHYGEEVSYVLEGTMIQLPGKEPQMQATGTPVHNAREVVHGGAKVVGDKPLKILTTHTVDKGKPLYAEPKESTSTR
jgi:quercetin dioxygenase-like cupin family protein